MVGPSEKTLAVHVAVGCDGIFLKTSAPSFSDFVLSSLKRLLHLKYRSLAGTGNPSAYHLKMSAPGSVPGFYTYFMGSTEPSSTF